MWSRSVKKNLGIDPNLILVTIRKLRSQYPCTFPVLGDVPNLSELILSSKNCRTSLPQCKNEHLEILGSKCPQLTFLDVSYVRTLTIDGLRFLAPDHQLGRVGQLSQSPNRLNCSSLEIKRKKDWERCSTVKTFKNGNTVAEWS